MVICKHCYNKIEEKVCDLLIVPGVCSICGAQKREVHSYTRLSKRMQMVLAMLNLADGSPIIDESIKGFLHCNVSLESVIIDTMIKQDKVIEKMAEELEQHESARRKRVLANSKKSKKKR